MKVLIWHVHGSWMTSFVHGPDEYLVPVVPDRGPDGRGRADTFTWPDRAREVTPEQLSAERVDVVVLQRPHEAELLERWTGLRAGRDLPAVYVEHNTPSGPAVATDHPLAGQREIPLVHVTPFNALMWDSGAAPVQVVEHGIIDPGDRYTGHQARVGVVVNEPVRRWRVAGTDLLLQVADQVPCSVYGMGMPQLVDRAPALAGHTHENVPQDQMHSELAHNRVYFHPYRWTSLGLSLLEAMALGMPVLALSTTAAPEAVPAEAGAVSSDPAVLVETARRLLADPDEARERGQVARRHVLERFGLERFLTEWQQLLKEVAR